MPQPLPRGHYPIFGPGKVLERPDLAAQIANVIADWRNVEEILELIYGQILRASISKNRQSHTITDTLSHQIFETIYLVEPKIKLIEKALKMLEQPECGQEFSK
jgi:hypothetical protein